MSDCLLRQERQAHVGPCAQGKEDYRLIDDLSPVAK